MEGILHPTRWGRVKALLWWRGTCRHTRTRWIDSGKKQSLQRKRSRKYLRPLCTPWIRSVIQHFSTFRNIWETAVTVQQGLLTEGITCYSYHLWQHSCQQMQWQASEMWIPHFQSCPIMFRSKCSHLTEFAWLFFFFLQSCFLKIMEKNIYYTLLPLDCKIQMEAWELKLLPSLTPTPDAGLQADFDRDHFLSSVFAFQVQTLWPYPLQKLEHTQQMSRELLQAKGCCWIYI